MNQARNVRDTQGFCFKKIGALTVLSLALPVGLNATDITGNLLLNPGAETGTLSNWTIGGVSNPGVDSGGFTGFDPGINPHTGSFDFFGRTGANGSLTQNVSLVGVAGVTLAMIDTGTLLAHIQFFEQGLNQGALSDDGFVQLTFRNGANGVISTVSTPEIDNHLLAWGSYFNYYAIPVNTRSIDYAMMFVRHVGNDLDAFFDDNSLAIATPEPSTFGMLFLGLGLVAASRRRT